MMSPDMAGIMGAMLFPLMRRQESPGPRVRRNPPGQQRLRDDRKRQRQNRRKARR